MQRDHLAGQDEAVFQKAKRAMLRRRKNELTRNTDSKQHTKLIFEAMTDFPDPNDIQRMSGHWGARLIAFRAIRRPTATHSWSRGQPNHPS
jgi:hypothetical protein